MICTTKKMQAGKPASFNSVYLSVTVLSNYSATASLSLALSYTALSLSSVGVTFATMNATSPPQMNPGRSSYTPVEAESPPKSQPRSTMKPARIPAIAPL